MGVFLFWAAILAWIVYAQYKKHLRKEEMLQLESAVNSKGCQLAALVQVSFLVRPCSRCQEFSMQLVQLSPNARSIQYQCTHCGKTFHAPAGTPQAGQAIDVWNELLGMVSRYNQISKKLPVSLNVRFEAPPAPLPYEQTTRTPIPEAVRSEVWRRDGGRCVMCGSVEQLQFDHIIPVSRGGATSVENLQLLCQQCNLVKGSKI